MSRKKNDKSIVSRFFKIEVDEDELNTEINNFITALNEKFEKVCDEKILFDRYKRILKFPDCSVSYNIIAKTYINFDILKKPNHSSLVKGVAVSLTDGLSPISSLIDS